METMQKNIMSTPMAILIVGGLFAWWLFRALTVAEFVVQKYLNQNAVDACLQVGYEEYSNQDGNSKAVTFNKQAYEFCMAEKAK